MPRRCMAPGAQALLLFILPASMVEGAVPPLEVKPLPRATEHAAGAVTAVPISGAAPAAPQELPALAGEPTLGEGRVIELPEEVVRASGVAFDDRGGVRLAVPSSETQKLPGGFADPLRFLQMLPGVSNDSDFDGLLYVRGGDGGQNRILLDQVSVSDAYHFGGVVSVLNTDVIDRLEFMPGGYTAEYGDALSGVLSVKRRIGNLSDVRGTASLSVLTANGTAEGPLGNDGRGSWLVAARRSFIDQVLKGHTSGPTALPAYWDMDARLFRRMGSHDVRFGLQRSGDRLSARLSDSFTFTPAESSGLTWDRTMTLASLNWEHAPGAWALSQALAYSWRDQSVELLGGLPQHASADTRTFGWRLDARRPAGDLVWGTGTQLTHSHTIYDLDINRLSVLEPDRRSNPRSPLDTARVVTSYEGRNVYVAGYAQAEIELADSAVTLTAGVRVEHSSRSGETLPTPRFRFAWATPVPGMVVSGSAGSYRQFPGERLEADPTMGNPDLGAERADHYTLGVSRTLTNGTRFSLEGYWKRVSDLIVYDDAAGDGDPPFVNTGVGTARGIEMLARLPHRRWDAWIAYTLGRVTYRDAEGGAAYAPAQDIRHTVALAARVRPAPGWTLGARWRLQSGRPYTAVTGRENVSEFVDGVTWIPVLGEYNGGRFPWYQRLDVRAERQFRIAGTHAQVFAEVVNALGRRNLYDYRYVDGYSRAEPVAMLPFLPTLGVTVAF